MAQRRNSSGRGDERSDLDDTKALAAKARSTTGGPIVAPNPAELSGVRPRRDSVIGARLTPSPRQTSGELPNWFFGALGFLAVLIVGFAGLVVLERSGKLDALLGAGTPTVATGPSAAAPAAEPAPAAETAPAPAPSAEKAAEPEPAPAARRAAEPAPAGEPPPTKAPAAEKVAEKEPAPPAEEPAAHGSKPAREHVAAAPSPKSHAGKPADPGTAEPGEGETEEAPAAAPAPKPVKAAAPAKPEADESDDDQSAPGQDAVEAALDALSTKVRGCFVKYQIKGTARVRLVATPGGSAESVNVTGDFEDTPTGMCVEGVVSSAKLPTFKGPPLKLSQSYQLR